MVEGIRKGPNGGTLQSMDRNLVGVEVGRGHSRWIGKETQGKER